MTDERWPRVKALFQAAVERPPEEREAFLGTATADEALRREVESLLRADRSDAGFLDQLPVAAVLTPGLRVDPYEVVAPLGAGAIGDPDAPRSLCRRGMPRRPDAAAGSRGDAGGAR